MRASIALALSGVVSIPAWGQVVASLPFTATQTAGPSATNYEPPDDTKDLWVIEDFSVSQDVSLVQFESRGTVFPSPPFVFDVTVHIYNGLPPAGTIVMSSLPGSGTVAPFAGWDIFRASFGGQILRAGSYFLVWNASTRTSQNQRALFWAQGRAHAAGGGQPDNAWQWNPGGWWGYPGNIRPVPQDLQGNGQTGVNYVLYGSPACYANCDGSTLAPVLNANGFQCFINRFASGSAAANCDGSTVAPVLTANDFQCFIDAYAAGCGR